MTDDADFDDGFIDNHPLVKLLGDTPRPRILAVLLQAGEPLNPARIYERAGIAERTWYNHVDDLLETGLVVQSGMAGNSPLYRFATEEELSEGDDRVEALEKLTDWTAHALRN